MDTVTEITIKSVEEKHSPEGVAFLVVEEALVLNDGTAWRGVHTFPADTLEWRAAEYGIDPADLDTLLDIVLHEPYMEEPDQPDLLLHDAPSIEEARTYHLARVKRVKARSKRPQPAGGPPEPVRERIKQLSVMNPEALDLKKALVGKARKARAEEKRRMAESASEPTSEAKRVERLRQAVTRPNRQQVEQAELPLRPTGAQETNERN